MRSPYESRHNTQWKSLHPCALSHPHGVPSYSECDLFFLFLLPSLRYNVTKLTHTHMHGLGGEWWLWSIGERKKKHKRFFPCYSSERERDRGLIVRPDSENGTLYAYVCHWPCSHPRERRWMHKSTTNGAFSLIAFAYSFDAEKRKVLVFCTVYPCCVYCFSGTML